MNRITLASSGMAAIQACVPADVDDLPRERGGQSDEHKDSLEGSLPPTVTVRTWINTDALSLVAMWLAGETHYAQGPGLEAK